MASSNPQAPKLRPPRVKLPFVGVTFACCKVYARIYLPHGKPLVTGFCPKCGARMDIALTPSGSKRRFFTAR